jgi:hypothetical protein
VSLSGEGQIYFDSTANKFLVSENGGAYVNLVATPVTTLSPLTGSAASAGANSTAVGVAASAGTNSVVVGRLASDSGGSNAVAIGGSATAVTGSVALGAGAIATATGQFVIGSSTAAISNLILGSGVTAAAPPALVQINVTAATGAANGSPLFVSAGAGGSTGNGGLLSLSGGLPTEGNGGGVTISGRTAITATAASHNGGAVSMFAGAATVAGTGGSVVIQGGTGGTTGTPGTVTMNGGSGGTTSGAGGAVTLQGGLPVDGNGGSVTVAGRNAATTTAAARTGGSVTISGGSSTTTAAGGSVTVQAGTGGSTSGVGGNLSLFAGSGGAAGATGGTVILAGGLAGDAATGGGQVLIQTARAGTGTALTTAVTVANTGAVTLSPSTAAGLSLRINQANNSNNALAIFDSGSNLVMELTTGGVIVTSNSAATWQVLPSVLYQTSGASFNYSGSMGDNGIVSNGTFKHLALEPSINFTNSTGAYDALIVNPTEVSAPPGPNYLARFQLGGSDRLTLDTAGNVMIAGKLTVVGAIDPPSVSLSGGTALFFDSADGSTAPISASGHARIRYNNGTTQWEQSVNGSAYTPLSGSVVTTLAPLTGASASATGSNALALGVGAVASGTAAQAIGNGAVAGTTFNNLAIGRLASSTGNNNAIAIGNASSASGFCSITIGVSSVVANTGSIVLGTGATDTAPNQFIAGAAGPTSKITDVYFGGGASSAAAESYTIHGTGSSTNGTSGGNITIAGGLANQAADAGGDVRLSVAVAGTGTTLTDKVIVSGSNGNVGIGNISPLSALDVSGSCAPGAVATFTTTSSLGVADSVALADATGGAFTITLPAAASAPRRRYVVKKIDASANVVTIQGNGAETIDGLNTQTLALQYDSLEVVCNGTAWFIIA